MCERWLSYENFLEDMGTRPGRRSIDRKCNDGNYTPENCRWATMRTQSRNKEVTVIIEHDGKRMCQSDWAMAVGLKPNTLSHRLKSGMSFKDALTIPAKRGGRRDRIGGKQ